MREGWEYKKFEACINKTPKPKQVKTEEYNSGTKYPIVSQEDKLISGYYDDESYVFHIDSPVVIFGDHTRVLKYVDFDFVVGADGVKIISPKQELNAKFLLYYLQWYKIPNLGYSRHYKLLKELNIPLPPKSTQLAIVSELDKINELIHLKKEQLKDFDNLAQSIFYEMFGDPVENEMGWEVNQLKDISTITSGYAFPSNDFSEDNPIKVVKITNVGVNEFVTDVSSLPLSYSSKESFKVKCGDIVIALTRTIISNGVKRALVPQSYDGALLNQRVAAIAVMHSCTAKNYIYQLLGTSFVKQYIESHATALNQPNLSITDLKRMPIPLPPLPLQHLFAQRIEQIEHQKAEVQKAIADLETLLASRMQYWFE